MAANATAHPCAYIAGDDAARKLVVLRLLLERLVDDLGELEPFDLDNTADRAQVRERLSDATMLAACALEEVAPLESRP